MKKLLLLLFLIPNLVMAQEKIVPVAEYTASNTDWQSNLYIIGGGKRDRTADPLHAMQVLSQLSYTPI